MKAPRWMLPWFDRLISRYENRDPDFVISPLGVPYLKRWKIIPRNPVLNIYLHNTVSSDDNRALHDHPWINVSVLLRGSYYEVVPEIIPGRAYRGGDPVIWVQRHARDIVFRMPGQAHALMLPGVTTALQPCWSLFITGPKVRGWGFFCARGWVSEKIYRRRIGNTSEIGQGCE